MTAPSSTPATPHYAQENGEVALTTLEASLRATVRLTVLTGQDLGATVGSFPTPFAETDTHWIPTGLHTSLDDAMRRCVRNSLTFLTEQFDFDSATAPAYLSAAGNFEISQIVDAVKGLHCMIRKADFADRA